MNKEQIIASIKKQYQSDDRPWIVGYSGGKDSTCVLQLVYEMLISLDPKERKKAIHVLSSDTLVESPIVSKRQRETAIKINAAAEKDKIPIHVEMLKPEIVDTFWVNTIGRGYPCPNKWFRWCTDRLKIKPMNKHILKHIKKNGEVLIVLGARKSESTSRSQTMGKYEIENSKLRKHGSIKGAFVFTPIEEFSESDVWTYLGKNLSPCGDDNSSLRNMYQRKDDEEIAFIIDESSPPSGHSRFGCWTCTVVDEDKALISLINDGHSEYKPLLEYRNYLKRIRDDPGCRDKFRKNQRIDKFISEYSDNDVKKELHKGHEVLGPFTLDTRHEMLIKLLETQDVIRDFDPDIELISSEEIKAIELLWIYDGDPIESIDTILEGRSEEDNIDKLISRLLLAEKDMSGLSRRKGVYKKIEQVILEYTMKDMTREDGKNRGVWKL